MAVLRLVLLGSVTALAGFLIGVQLGDADPAPEPEPDTLESPATDPETDPRIDELTGALESARIEADALREALAAANARATQDANGESGAESPIPTASLALSGGGGGPGRVIRSLAEAEAAYERARKSADLETLWLLGADLLALGEPGYAVFEELFARLMTEAEGDPVFREITRDDEQWLGGFFRALAEEHESFLAYGVDLVGRDPASLPPAIQRLRHEILDDDLLPVILGFHRGENPALTGAWLDTIEGLMLHPSGEMPDDDTILGALAQLPEDRAVALILAWIDVEGTRLDDVVRALAAQGSPAAMNALGELLPTITDPNLRAAIETIIAR